MKLSMKARGFTLLEIMVAIGIMGLSLVTLIRAQARSIVMSQEAQQIIIASQLARVKLGDCTEDVEKLGFSHGNYAKQGDLSDFGRPEFIWECYSYPYNVPMPSPDVVKKGVGSMKNRPGSLSQVEDAASMMAPFLGLMSKTLGDSIREVALVIRWKNGSYDESMRVVTHIIDRGALSQLALALNPEAARKAAGGGVDNKEATSGKPENPSTKSGASTTKSGGAGKAFRGGRR